jgi:DNA-binding response OmpR family regulator
MLKKILIIDNEPNVCESISDILEEKGYELIKASSAKEGLEKAKKERPDLVLLDTRLGGDIDGLELCRQLKQVEKLDCKVIVYTGKIDAIDAVKARENGADEYCVKGTDPGLLIETVEKLI